MFQRKGGGNAGKPAGSGAITPKNPMSKIASRIQAGTSHLGKKAHKFKFEIICKTVYGIKEGTFFLKWTRGDKSTSTKPKRATRDPSRPDAEAEFYESITLISTLYRDDRTGAFDQKESKLMLVQLKRGPNGRKMERLVGRATLDLSKYLGMPHRQTDIQLQLNGDKVIAGIQMSCTFLKSAVRAGAALSDTGSKFEETSSGGLDGPNMDDLGDLDMEQLDDAERPAFATSTATATSTTASTPRLPAAPHTPERAIVTVAADALATPESMASGASATPEQTKSIPLGTVPHVPGSPEGGTRAASAVVPRRTPDGKRSIEAPSPDTDQPKSMSGAYSTNLQMSRSTNVLPNRRAFRSISPRRIQNKMPVVANSQAAATPSADWSIHRAPPPEGTQRDDVNALKLEIQKLLEDRERLHVQHQNAVKASAESTRKLDELQAAFVGIKNEFDAQSAELESTAAKVDTLTLEGDNLRARDATLTAELAVAAKDLEAKDAELQSKESADAQKVAALEAKIEESSVAMATLQATLAKSKSELDAKTAESARSVASLEAALSTQQSDSQTKAKESMLKMAALEAALAKQQAELRKAAEQNAALTRDDDAKLLREELDKERSERERLSVLHAAVLTEREATTAARSTGQGDLELLQRRLQESQSQSVAERQKLEQSVATQAARIAALSTELAQSKQEATARSTEQGELEALQQRLQESESQSAAERQKLEETVATQTARIAALSTELAQSKQETTARSTEQGELEALRQRLQESQSQSAAERQKLEETVATQTARIAALSTELAQSKQETTTRSTEQGELEVLQQSLQESQSQHAAERQKLEATVESHFAQITALASELSFSRKDAATAQTELQTLRGEAEGLRSELEAAQKEALRLRDEQLSGSGQEERSRGIDAAAAGEDSGRDDALLKQIEEKDAAVAALRAEIDGLKADRDKLAKMHSEQAAEIAQLQEGAREEVHGLEELVTQLEAERDKLMSPGIIEVPLPSALPLTDEPESATPGAADEAAALREQIERQNTNRKEMQEQFEEVLIELNAVKEENKRLIAKGSFTDTSSPPSTPPSQEGGLERENEELMEELMEVRYNLNQANAEIGRLNEAVNEAVNSFRKNSEMGRSAGADAVDASEQRSGVSGIGKPSGLSRAASDNGRRISDALDQLTDDTREMKEPSKEEYFRMEKENKRLEKENFNVVQQLIHAKLELAQLAHLKEENSQFVPRAEFRGRGGPRSRKFMMWG